MIVAAADGSSLANPGPSGWAWYVDEAHWAAGGWSKGTNNMGELMSVLDLLRSTKKATEPLLVLCDSQYAINCCTRWIPAWKKRGWRKADNKPVLNLDLLKQLDEELTGRKVTFQWVKGHAGHPLNEQADTLARAAATAYQQGTPVATGPGFSSAPMSPGPSTPPEAPDPSSTLAPPARVGPGPSDPPDVTLPGPPSAPAADPPPLPDPAPQLPLAEEATDAASRRVGASPFPTPVEPPEPLRQAQPDLFSLPPAVRPPREEAESDLVVKLTELTRELMSDQAQLDRERLDQLMHPEYVAHQADGLIRTRGSILARPATLAGPIQLDVLGGDRLGENQVLLRYKMKQNSQGFLCAALWQRTGQNWRVRFQQFTPIPG